MRCILSSFLSSDHSGISLRAALWQVVSFGLAWAVVVWGRSNPTRLWRTSRPLFHLTRSLLMLVMPIGFAWAVSAGASAAFVWGVFWAAPLLAVALASAFLGERPSPLLCTGAAIGWLGVILTLEPGWHVSAVAVLAAIVTSVSFGVYIAMTRSLRAEPVAANLFYTGAGVFAALSFALPGVWISPGPHDDLIFIGIGSVGFIALLALDRAIGGAPVAVSAPALQVQVLCIALIGALSARQLLPAHVLVGVILIAGAALLAWVRLPPARAARGEAT